MFKFVDWSAVIWLCFLWIFGVSCNVGNNKDGSTGYNTKIVDSKRTFQGRNMNIQDVPYLILVEMISEGTTFFCTGVLINVKWVLSAAHCFMKKPLSIKVMFGLNKYRYGEEDDSTTREVIRVITYPYYKPTKHITLNPYDIALLELKSDIKLSTIVKPIEIYDQSWPINSGKRIKRKCFAAGYGNNQYGIRDYSYIRAADYNLQYTKDSCECKGEQQYILCGKATNNASTCSGDSGGPLVCENKLVGIVQSHFSCLFETPDAAQDCRADKMNALTYICPHTKWIRNYTQMDLKNCTDHYDRIIYRGASNYASISYNYLIIIFIKLIKSVLQ